MIFKYLTVVTLYKNKGYNPLTTAYNQNKVTTDFCNINDWKTINYKAVVGCKRFWKIFYFFEFFDVFSRPRLKFITGFRAGEVIFVILASLWLPVFN